MPYLKFRTHYTLINILVEWGCQQQERPFNWLYRSILLEQVVSVLIEQHILIKFLTLENVESYVILRSDETVRWKDAIENPSLRLAQEIFLWRPRTSTTDSNIEAVRQHIDGDRHPIISGIALEFGISSESTPLLSWIEEGKHKVEKIKRKSTREDENLALCWLLGDITHWVSIWATYCRRCLLLPISSTKLD